MFNKSSFYTIRTIGLMICYFILSFSFIRSQSITHKISDNYKLVSSLTDSMNQYTQWYFNGKIDTILFLTQKENFNNQIFNLIVANSDLMYQLIDSINQDNYPKPIEELMDTTLIIESDYPTQEATGSEIMDTLSDSSFQTPYPEIPQRSRTFSPMNIAGKVMTMNSGKRTTLHLQFGMYFNNWNQSTLLRGNHPIKINMWKSFNLFGDLSLIWKTHLGKPNNPLNIYYGLGFDNRQFTMKYNFSNVIRNEISTPLDTISYDQIRLKGNYFNIPLGIELKVKKTRISIGTYFGFRIKQTRYGWYQQYDQDIKIKIKDNYGLNQNNYGLSLSLGKKRTALSFNYDLSKLIDNQNMYQIEFHPWRMGLVIKL
ncbi:MAG: hypothetical protein IPO85_06770 [Saprospiraceae bacterium]|uniref:Outer membrane protein beta-barrel domain-containing protein n=1 Tax=Candidatus Defluviibacterium haderslevense TaxID=2981993 RepID=A0A9D7XCV7_9BACT|nr:hypothetical protein [Candidatus Defluviibacterium haderslevense]